jgi:stage II sporulation protein D
VAWAENAFTFSVTGYGHGVGMSQYGANALARDGEDFRGILTWYYTGTQIDSLW